MSPQHLLQPPAAAQLCHASHQCCRPVDMGYCSSNGRSDCPEVSAEENNEARMTEKIITVSAAEIISLPSCSYPILPKHLIFAQLLIFVSSLFAFPAAQFTCCCWDYPALQARRFLLLKQLRCCVCFEHAQDSINELLNVFCLTGLALCVCALTEAVKLEARKSCFVLSAYLTGSCQVKEQTVTLLCLACGYSWHTASTSASLCLDSASTCTEVWEQGLYLFVFSASVWDAGLFFEGRSQISKLVQAFCKEPLKWSCQWPLG